MSDRDDITELELMVDKHSLGGVLQMLAEICNEKASHLESNWQDRETAKVWQRDAAKIDKLNIAN
jgi:hypothetical protein